MMQEWRQGYVTTVWGLAYRVEVGKPNAVTFCDSDHALDSLL